MGEVRCTLPHPLTNDKVMKRVPYGKVITIGKIREYFARESGGDFTEPITAGIFCIHCSVGQLSACRRRNSLLADTKGQWRAECKISRGIEAQKEKLEAEGHIIIQKGRKNLKYYVKDYERVLFDL